MAFFLYQYYPVVPPGIYTVMALILLDTMCIQSEYVTTERKNKRRKTKTP